MAAEQPFFQRITGFGPTIQAQGLAVTPESSAVIIRIPYGGFVWNRPSGVIVDDGQERRRISVIDPTLIIVLGLMAATVGTAIAAAIFRMKPVTGR